MKDFLPTYRDSILIFAASILLVIAGPIWAYFALRGIREPLILHFSTYTGINQIGGLETLAAVGFTALLVVCVNASLAFALKSREPVLGKLISLVTLLLALLLFIGFMAIISVNS